MPDDKEALIVYDVGTDWLEVVPIADRSTETVGRALRYVMGSSADKCKLVTCDRARELEGAANTIVPFAAVSQSPAGVPKGKAMSQ